MHREATSEVMLDSKGKQIKDEPVELTLSELKSRVAQAIAGGAQK